MCKVLTAQSCVREHQKLQPGSACKFSALLISSELRAAVLPMAGCNVLLHTMLERAGVV